MPLLRHDDRYSRAHTTALRRVGHYADGDYRQQRRQLDAGNAGCGVLGWLVIVIFILVAGAVAWSSNFITSATRTISSVIENQSSNSPEIDSIPEFNFTLPTIEEALAPAPRLAAAPILLNGNENAATQMVVTAYEEDGAILLGFDPAERVETWRSAKLSDEYYQMGLTADAARVYMADGATLMALDRNSGETVWQSSLANNLQTGCAESDPCLQQVGDQTVALARDGTIQGFAGSTGAPLWSRRLNTQPRQFLVNGDQVIVVDNDDNNRAVVVVINGVNGDVLYELYPSCTFPNIEMRPHSSDQFHVTPDGSALIIVSSGTYACAWRYQLSDGALVWSYTADDDEDFLPFTWSMSSLAVADPIVYFVNEEGDATQIYGLDTQSEGATPQLLYEVEDYELTVQYPLGDLLLVSAQPDYASDEVELWAIDRNNGERRWQRKLETTHTFDKWVTRPTDQGLFVAVCSWDDDDCRFEVLDITTGASKGQIREEAGYPFSGAAWRGNQGFLTINGKLYVMDLTTGEIEYTWP